MEPVAEPEREDITLAKIASERDIRIAEIQSGQETRALRAELEELRALIAASHEEQEQHEDQHVVEDLIDELSEEGEPEVVVVNEDENVEDGEAEEELGGEQVEEELPEREHPTPPAHPKKKNYFGM